MSERIEAVRVVPPVLINKDRSYRCNCRPSKVMRALKFSQRPQSVAFQSFSKHSKAEHYKSQPSAAHAETIKAPMARLQVGEKYTAGTPMIILMTEKLLEMFAQCNRYFVYDKRLNPRRVLTRPSKPVHNNGCDNERHDYILYVNDLLGNEEGRKYLVLDLLGQGTFGQVVRCQNVDTGEFVAIKVIKNQPAFFNQSMMEVTVLEMLNQKYDRANKRHVIRMRDTFVFRQHLCIVVELLSLNLYELIKQNQYRGFSLTLCRVFLAQIIDALLVLKEARIIHCDLKPENILLRTLESPGIKVIDFGSACHEHQTLYTYIQSRFYRAPEVLLGLPYSASIDMWSLGCIAAELFLGLPVFPGASNYDQISRIVGTFGIPPNHMIELGKDAHLYFERNTSSLNQSLRSNSFGAQNDVRPRVFNESTLTKNINQANDSYSIDKVSELQDNNHRKSVDSKMEMRSRPKYVLKTRERYTAETGRTEQPSKQYFSSSNLTEIILGYPLRPRDMSPADKEKEMTNRRCFLDLLRGLLALNPLERWTPLQVSQHPFLTGKPFITPFVPIDIPQVGSNQSSDDLFRRSPTTALTTAVSNLTTDGKTINSSEVGPKNILPVAKVNIGNQGRSGKTRPRSNTLSSLSLATVPTQLQRVSAAAAASGEKNELPTPSADTREPIISLNDGNYARVASDFVRLGRASSDDGEILPVERLATRNRDLIDNARSLKCIDEIDVSQENNTSNRRIESQVFYPSNHGQEEEGYGEKMISEDYITNNISSHGNTIGGNRRATIAPASHIPLSSHGSHGDKKISRRKSIGKGSMHQLINNSFGGSFGNGSGPSSSVPNQICNHQSLSQSSSGEGSIISNLNSPQNFDETKVLASRGGRRGSLRAEPVVSPPPNISPNANFLNIKQNHHHKPKSFGVNQKKKSGGKTSGLSQESLASDNSDEAMMID